MGVVEYKVYIREDGLHVEDGIKTRKSFQYADGDVYPGDYLSIVTFGVADVRVDSDESISAGEPLAAGDGSARKLRTTEVNGIMIAENTGTVGKALEDYDGSGTIKAFVNCR